MKLAMAQNYLEDPFLHMLVGKEKVSPVLFYFKESVPTMTSSELRQILPQFKAIMTSWEELTHEM
jgi:hypothetical protein